MLVGCGEPVVVKQYHRARMQPKHLHKLEREIATMRTLQQHASRTAGAAGGGGQGCGEAQGDGEQGVVALLEVFEDPSSIYLLMECCEGGDLFKRLMLHGGRLPEQWVAVEVSDRAQQQRQQEAGAGRLWADRAPRGATPRVACSRCLIMYLLPTCCKAERRRACLRTHRWVRHLGACTRCGC